MIYFISDAHLGSRVIADKRKHEQHLTAWLDFVKTDATAIYMLGDMFDFWFEYKTTAPKGYVRFLGKIAELADKGIEIHFFTGNHDIWTFGYLENEIGLKVHRTSEVIKIGNKNFYLAHGDLEHDESRSFRFMTSIFHNKTAQKLFAFLPANWGQEFGYRWSEHNRRRENEEENAFKGEDGENIILFSKKYAETHPEIDYFIYGHRHILVDILIFEKKRVIILGDFISLFTYGKFDGEDFMLEHFLP